MKPIALLILAFSALSHSLTANYRAELYYWMSSDDYPNFGDYLSKVIVERMTGETVVLGDLKEEKRLLLGIGSIINCARDGDIVWGSGYRENPLLETGRYKLLDVRAVRGPLTRRALLQMGIPCPEVYGDPALLLPRLFPEFHRETPVNDYIIIPNRGEVPCFSQYKNVVVPIQPWDQVVKSILQSKLVISSSLHAIIVAEAFGIPARLLKMTWVEPIFKYQDYYESTGRPNFRFATSVHEALEMGGEIPIQIDLTEQLLKSFPYDYFE